MLRTVALNLTRYRILRLLFKSQVTVLLMICLSDSVRCHYLFIYLLEHLMLTLECIM